MNTVQPFDIVQPALSIKAVDNQLVIDLVGRFESLYNDITDSYQYNVLENTDNLNEDEFSEMENRFYGFTKCLERLQESFMYMEHTFSC